MLYGHWLMSLQMTLQVVPINPINSKLIGYAHMVEVNIYTKFDVIWTRFNFVSNLGLLADL